MKKTVALTILTLILLTGILYLINMGNSKDLNQKTSGQEKNNSNSFLQYWIVSQRERPFSVNHAHSDVATNSLIMDALVGTLVKENESGELAPYLAKKWTVSNDEKIWTFTLKEQLETEDNVPIIAQTFVENLNHLLRIYSKDGSAMQFDHLEGWHSFAAGKTKHISGMKALDEFTVEFRFVKKPIDFLDLLKTSYFGFYSPANFKGDDWIDDKAIISSGAYSLKEITKDNQVTLIKRDNWPLGYPKSPKKIKISFTKELDPTLLKGTNIIQTTPDITSDKFTLVNGIPSFISVMVLSPLKDGPFKHALNRKAFANEVFNLKTNSPLKSSRSKITNWFNFLHQPKSKNLASYGGTNWQSETKTLVATNIGSFLSSSEKKWIENLIETAAKKFNINVSYEEPHLSDPKWVEKALSNTAYDIRIVNVHVGGYVSNANNKMMFCSNLGVRFPDPSGKICQLVSEYEKKEINFDDEYIDRFYSALFSDAVVVPFFHFGLTWYYSNDIDLQGISPITDFPRFELLKIND